MDNKEVFLQLWGFDRKYYVFNNDLKIKTYYGWSWSMKGVYDRTFMG